MYLFYHSGDQVPDILSIITCITILVHRRSSQDKKVLVALNGKHLVIPGGKKCVTHCRTTCMLALHTALFS